MLLILLTLACKPSPADLPPTDHLTADALREATLLMTALGARQVATPEEAEAQAILEQAFTTAGLEDVRADPFVFDAWRPGTAQLEVGGQTYAVEALSPSPATELTAPLMSEDEDFEGAVVLMSSDTGERGAHYIRAALGGAVGLIRITEDLDYDGAPLVEVGHTLEGSAFPSVAVSAPVGDTLEAQLGSPVRMTVDPDIAVDHESFNVVGRVPGTGSGTVYVVAHYDSWHPSESAFDNGLGVGALLVLARQLAQGPAPERDVVFLATSGEEQGLQGAIAWVDQNAEAIGPTDLVITLDVLWSGEGSFVCMATSDAWRTLAVEMASAEGLDAVRGGDPGISSDHFPFVLRGAEAIWCGRFPDRHYHTVADTLDNLDLDDAAAATRVQWRLLAEAAGFEVP